MKTIQTAQKDKKSELLFYLLLLTAGFIALEVSYFIQCYYFYIESFSNLSNQFSIPVSILPGIFFFLFIQFSIHLIFCLLIWRISLALIKIFSIAPIYHVNFAMGVWVFGIVTFLVANQVYFPNSKWAELTSAFLFNPVLLSVSFWILVCIFSSLLLLTLFDVIFATKRAGLIGFLLLSIVVASTYVLSYKKSEINFKASATKPNIILIGIDSLRPDFIQSVSANHQLPFIESFVNHSVFFPETITPIARTNPSWMSILTGQYPIHHGVRFDLPNLDKIDFRETLPTILRQQGYTTIYATDESRFSNVDHNYGFEKIISPPMGLNDFIIGTLNDFPLSNLLVNTKLGKYIFPYSYANRAVMATYDPDTFIALLTDELTEVRQPTFFAIHFCLPHYPYTWRDNRDAFQNGIKGYENSLQRVDQQVRDFYQLLKQRKLLDNAIVILLSDHGEALEMSGDRITDAELYVTSTQKIPFPKFFPPALEKEEVNQSAGHGTDILSLTQHNSLFAIRVYGGAQFEPKIVLGTVSLMDIKPTLLDILQLPEKRGLSDGQSLLPYMSQSSGPVASRYLFLETDFSPQAIRTIHPDAAAALLEGIGLFEANKKTNRLVVKDEMGKMIINSKQYANIYKNWMLALYPQTNQTFIPILVNLATGQWTNQLDSEFAMASPANAMLAALQTFYGAEINKKI